MKNIEELSMANHVIGRYKEALRQVVKERGFDPDSSPEDSSFLNGEVAPAEVISAKELLQGLR